MLLLTPRLDLNFIQTLHNVPTSFCTGIGTGFTVSLAVIVIGIVPIIIVLCCWKRKKRRGGSEFALCLLPVSAFTVTVIGTCMFPCLA